MHVLKISSTYGKEKGHFDQTKHVHGQKLLKLYFFLKKLFLFFSIHSNSSGLSVSLEEA